MTKPLSGIRVLEFSQIAAGPFAGSLLADLGADVVKVERPGDGDGLRGWPPLIVGENDIVESGNFASVNRNKRSITIDMKDDRDLERLYRLVAVADIFIENYRPGVTRRLKVSYEDLKKHNPRLVYCSITGYGQAGPYAKKGAFDVTVQAMSGLMSVTGEEGGLPVKCGVPVGDFAAGLYGAYASLAAVFRARQTGKGAHIDCSMLGSLLGLAALQTSEYFGNRVAPRRLGSAHPRNAPYQAYEAKDRSFTVAAGNDKLWREFCSVVEMPDLLTDTRFETQSARAANQKALTALLQPVFLTKNAEDWLSAFDEKGIPCAPVLDYAEVLSNEQVHYMGLIRTMTLSNGRQTDTVAFPIGISDYEFEIDRVPPRIGEHNFDVLSDWLRTA